MMIKLENVPGKLLVGLSGGADSVALLLLLMEAGADAAAVHVNHGLRGEQSDGDEAFVRNLCDGLRVPLLVYRACPPEHPGEGWAREARYGFFREAMRESGADALVLAHHRDDQADGHCQGLLNSSKSVEKTIDNFFDGFHCFSSFFFSPFNMVKCCP